MKIKNNLGLSISFLENGAIQNIDIDTLRIGVRVPSLYSKPGINLYLRKRSNPFQFTALLGPDSPGMFSVTNTSYISKGSWAGLEYSCCLRLSSKSLSWQWSVEIINKSGEPVETDLYYLQDAGLKPITAGLNNEYYISQYLERRILEDKNFGSVICCRQNMKDSTGNPWLMLACRNGASGASVDGMQFYGKTYRATGVPEGLLSSTPGGEYAGESSCLALQEKPFTLKPGEFHKSLFLASYLPDHPEATSESDLLRLPELMREPTTGEDPAEIQKFASPVINIFNTSPLLPVDDLDGEEMDEFFGKERRFSETENGRLLSFFCKQNDHVVLREKELLTDRPHAHIMQANSGNVPDENIMSTTAFAFGVFNSHLTQGNTNFNTLLSVNTSPFNLTTGAGQRIFVEIDRTTYLLGVPSAFEMGLNHCRWIYKHGENYFQVRTWTAASAARVNMDFSVIRGKKVRLLITHDFDRLNGWTVNQANTKDEFIITPSGNSMITGKFPQAQFRLVVNNPANQIKASGAEALYQGKNIYDDLLFVLEVSGTKHFCMSFIGEVCSPANISKIQDPDEQWISDYLDSQSVLKQLCLSLSLKGNSVDTAAIEEILPWYTMNALIHYLTPYGLEQFSGAAWGTRDIAQGPFDLLLGMEKYDAAREVLRIIFSNQNTDGGWPQWWMFDSYKDVRAGDSHGDVFYWCIIALSNYIKVTGDTTILDEILPFYQSPGSEIPGKMKLSGHLDRLVDMIKSSFIPGTALVPFGGGDWNDSLQPVSRELAERMISSWTVEMNFQAFSQLSDVYEMAGLGAKAQELKEICNNISMDFNKHLIKDGVVAGYGLIEENGTISLLLHPSDTKTNIQYSILPMNRGIISGIFTGEQALHHQELIDKHLKGPDGARLMNRPLKYKGGIQRIFQRAESSTFFGREIGLMYVHEHIRYAESQAILGKADMFIKAMRQAIPVGYRDTVSCGDIRQANCYYSSSDVTFRSRYEADELYDKIKTGSVTLKGGWRVYSSGPGIYVSLVVSRLLGLRTEFGKTILDPVIPRSMDGLSASLNYLNHAVKLSYSIKDREFSPQTILVNGKNISFNYEENKYRRGGAVFLTSSFLAALDEEANTIEIVL